MKLANTVALVSGSNRGLGRRLVEGLLARGAGKIYAASRDGRSSFPDPRVVPLQLDLTDRASIAAAAQARDVALMINNAGVFTAGPVVHATDEQLRRDMDVNYFGLIDAIRAFVPVLARQAPDAAIVNVLSLVSFANWSTFGGYSATKAAAWSLTQALRVELRAQRIQVHAAFPGMIDTDMSRGYPGDKASPAVIAAGILDGIEAGTADIAPDPVSAGAMALYLNNPNDLIASFAG